MFRTTLLAVLLFAVTELDARTIPVKDLAELNKANAEARPGDIIVLQNGIWNNVLIRLNCSGTESQPVVFRAATPGKVFITGLSNLRIGGNYIIVNGLYFKNGYSPSGPVIDFHINDKQLANNCRVTNTVINDFNKPKRLDEDYWIAFFGKKNRLDHCSFVDKKNLGVLLAVILDDDRSRENFHSIDSNYFGRRPPLASNGGEIIRVGVSQHCQFNSNTQIHHNLFEHCDGETEIISIKSGRNVISNNVFKECQGSVVLRHGDNNIVAYNLFYGNGKQATGGVRVINRGQWVINNLFYKCRGESFKAPLAIMNGIPNSPANRYVQVTYAVIMYNSFVESSPLSFGEGSDAERTLPPDQVGFSHNLFYNTKDPVVYYAHDKLDGIHFVNNEISAQYHQNAEGFNKTGLKTMQIGNMVIPLTNDSVHLNGYLNDSMRSVPTTRWDKSTTPVMMKEMLSVLNFKGAGWFREEKKEQAVLSYTCRTAAELYTTLSKPGQKNIKLTGAIYQFDRPLVITEKLSLSGNKTVIAFKTAGSLNSLFVLKNKGQLSLSDLKIDAGNCKLSAFVSSDTAGSSEHYNFKMVNCDVRNLQGCSFIFKANKSAVADSVIIRNSVFSDFNNAFSLADEKDDKGYYNAEKISIVNNTFINGKGVVLDVYRGGNDESTLGPDLSFSKNRITRCNAESKPLFSFSGVQKTLIEDNTIVLSNRNGILIQYADIVRAKHLLSNNKFLQSGRVVKDPFVTEKNNVITQ